MSIVPGVLAFSVCKIQDSVAMNLDFGDKNDRIAQSTELSRLEAARQNRETIRWILKMVPLLKRSRYYKAIFYSSQETVILPAQSY